MKIAVFFLDPLARDYPLDKKEYWISYQELAAEIENLGGEFFVVRGQKTFLGNGKFSKSWQFKNGNLVETGEISVDKIYDKSIDGVEFRGDGRTPILNPKFVNDVCTNKFLTAEIFPEFCPQTFLAKNETEFLENLKKIRTKKKVAKPVDGDEGKNVFIGDDEFLKKCPRKFPILLQEFLDSSDGIPGIFRGLHDFRVVAANGEIIFSFFRTPAAGSLISNFSRGGRINFFDKKKIPPEIFPILKKIDEKFAPHGDRVFGADFVFTKNGPKIIELNSRVGLQQNSRHPSVKFFKKKLAEILVKK